GFGLLKLGNAGGSHKEAVIRQDGKIIRRIDLDTVIKPEEIIIKDDYTNRLLVEKGRIRFVDADCPNKDCVKTGWLSEKGSVAVCLPNKAMINIEGANVEIDGGTF
ncbi:MAG: NusG domain II-containing protein, partial [Ruminiclostridium sp.]|nr:NusG domain II-containing protein [Ruminiclostridium sp.]